MACLCCAKPGPHPPAALAPSPGPLITATMAQAVCMELAAARLECGPACARMHARGTRVYSPPLPAPRQGHLLTIRIWIFQHLASTWPRWPHSLEVTGGLGTKIQGAEQTLALEFPLPLGLLVPNTPQNGAPTSFAHQTQPPSQACLGRPSTQRHPQGGNNHGDGINRATWTF